MAWLTQFGAFVLSERSFAIKLGSLIFYISSADAMCKVNEKLQKNKLSYMTLNLPKIIKPASKVVKDLS